MVGAPAASTDLEVALWLEMTHRARREGLWLGIGEGTDAPYLRLPASDVFQVFMFISYLLLWQIIVNTICFSHTILWKSDRDREEIRSRCQLCVFLPGDWWEKNWFSCFCSVSRSWLSIFLESWLSPTIKENCVTPILAPSCLLTLLSLFSLVVTSALPIICFKVSLLANLVSSSLIQVCLITKFTYKP